MSKRDNLTLEERLAIIRETAVPIKALTEVSEVAKFLYHNSFSFTLNANDTFGWACADAVEVSFADLPKLLEVERLFGADGLNAFMALVRECDVMDELQCDRYWEAVEFLKNYRPCSWVEC